MAASSLAIDTSKITTFANDDMNSVTNLNTTISEIVTKFNALIETATGHYHDGTDSRLIYGGITGMTQDDYAMYLLARAGGGRL